MFYDCRLHFCSDIFDAMFLVREVAGKTIIQQGGAHLHGDTSSYISICIIRKALSKARDVNLTHDLVKVVWVLSYRYVCIIKSTET